MHAYLHQCLWMYFRMMDPTYTVMIMITITMIIMMK
jgi:hypothetical protein